MKILEELVVSFSLRQMTCRTSQLMASVKRRWPNSLATLRNFPISRRWTVLYVEAKIV